SAEWGEELERKWKAGGGGAGGEGDRRERALPASDLHVLAEEPSVATAEEVPAAIRGRSLGQIAWRRLRRDKVAMAGGVFIIFITLLATLPGPITHRDGHLPNTRHNLPPPTPPDPATPNPHRPVRG